MMLEKVSDTSYLVDKRPWMTGITSGSMQVQGGLHAYLEALSPRRNGAFDDYESLFFMSLIDKDWRQMIHNPELSKEKVLRSSDRNLLMKHVRIPLPTGGGKKTSHILDMNIEGLANTVAAEFAEGGFLHEKLGVPEIPCLVKTYGGTSTLVDWLLSEGLFPVRLAPNSICVSFEFPLWKRPVEVRADLAAKIGLEMLDPTFNGKIILFNFDTRPSTKEPGRELSVHMAEALQIFVTSNRIYGRDELYLGADLADLDAKIKSDLDSGPCQGRTLFVADASLIRNEEIRKIKRLDESSIDIRLQNLARNAASIILRLHEMNRGEHEKIFRLAWLDLIVTEDIFGEMDDTTISVLDTRLHSALKAEGFKITSSVIMIHALPRNFMRNHGVLILKLAGDQLAVLATLLRRAEPHYKVPRLREPTCLSNERKDPVGALQEGWEYVVQKYFRELIEKSKRVSEETGFFKTFPESFRKMFEMIPGYPRV